MEINKRESKNTRGIPWEEQRVNKRIKVTFYLKSTINEG